MKTEMKDLDSLLANKEQTDKALAELAASYREKLHRLEAISPTPQAETTKAFRTFELNISKQFWTWFWRVVACVAMFVLIWGAMALLKEPRANGNANACAHVSHSIETPMTAGGGESVTIQQQRTKLFQRRP